MELIESVFHFTHLIEDYEEHKIPIRICVSITENNKKEFSLKQGSGGKDIVNMWQTIYRMGNGSDIPIFVSKINKKTGSRKMFVEWLPTTLNMYLTNKYIL